jgi:hypothetical protein
LLPKLPQIITMHFIALCFLYREEDGTYAIWWLLHPLD